MSRWIVLFMLIAITAIAQPEQPEPEFSSSLYSYEAEIAWGSKTDLVWESVTVVAVQIMSPDYEMPDHFYGIVLVGNDRLVYWTGKAPTGQIVRIGIDLPPMENWWGFYRARFRAFPFSDWSEASSWVAVIDLSAMPVIGAFVAEIEG